MLHDKWDMYANQAGTRQCAEIRRCEIDACGKAISTKIGHTIN